MGNLYIDLWSNFQLIEDTRLIFQCAGSFQCNQTPWNKIWILQVYMNSNLKKYLVQGTGWRVEVHIKYVLLRLDKNKGSQSHTHTHSTMVWLSIKIPSK